MKEFQPKIKEMLAKAALISRGLSMDAVAAAKSGHLGLPLGATEVGAVLFGYAMRYNPEDPEWLNRDRFILSAGHGSMFLYSWLHLAGYGLPLEEIKNFRQLHSHTPGHPESFETPGVECTTGPLGQGVGNAVGIAAAAKIAAAKFNTDKHTIFDHEVICLCGDGCMQEGVASEACSLAGHWGLDNLILIYDANDVTLDAMAAKTQSEITAERFEAYGFDVVTINGHNMDAFLIAYTEAKANKNGRPKLIIIKTLIGKGIAEVEGTAKAHGEAGVAYVDEARKKMGLPEQTFYVSEEVKTYFAEHRKELKAIYEEWQKTFHAWQRANPELAKVLEMGMQHAVPQDLLSKVPEFAKDAKVSTRVAGGTIINVMAKEMPLLISGSADLHGSTKNYLKDMGDFDRLNRLGRNFYFGIREHAMGAIVNGIGYYGIFRASGATFLVFSDYMRPAIRIAAVGHLPIFHILTHDSVGVGEDGPTHQPVETISSLRLIPNLDVVRPADAEETVGAYVAALNHKDGPTALILSRQDLPMLNDIPVEARRNGPLQGGYIAWQENGPLKLILIATGSELHLALEAAKELGNGVRVVSMPCCERFGRQREDYRETVLPSICRKRIAIEAGATAYWYKYVGLDGKVIGIDHFGLSAPGPVVMKELGITKEHLVQEARRLMGA